jgi:hypothetical protein
MLKSTALLLDSIIRNSVCTMPAKKFWPSSVNKKKNCNPYFSVIMITVLIMNYVISTIRNVYLRLSMYYRGQNTLVVNVT